MSSNELKDCLLPLLLGHHDDLPALICHKTDSVLSYKWLRQSSLLLTHRLQSHHVIGICFGATTAGSVVAMVAALRVGRPFLLLDTTSLHLVGTCERANCRIVIYDEGSLSLEQADHLSERVALYRIQDLFKESDHDMVQDLKTKEPIVYSPLLYLMETSGSSGNPKLVQCPAAGALNRIQWQLKYFPFEKAEVALARTSLAFVDCIAEIFAPLAVGIPLVVLDDRHASEPSSRLLNPWRDPRLVLNACREYQVSRLVVTPTFLKELLRYGPLSETAPALQYLHSSGEPLPKLLARSALASASPNLKLLNIYGATEVGADVTYTVVNGKDLENDATPYVSAGQPLPGCQIHLVSHQTDGIWREANEEGEVVVAGCQVAAGYLSTPCRHAETPSEELSQTHSGFCWMTTSANNELLFSRKQQEGSIWCFRTGDLAWRDADRRFFILGRQDQNVKIRGQKVSLLEVEAALRSTDLNGVAAIIPWGSGEDESEAILVALVSGHDSKESCSCRASPHLVHECRNCELSIRQQIQQHLRPAAIPQRILFRSDLPKLASGKIDRRQVKELLALTLSQFSKQSSVVHGLQCDPFSREAWLQWFIGQFQAILGLAVNPDDNFFECGGSSITCIRLLSNMRTQIDALGLEECSGKHTAGFLQEVERNATPIGLAKVMELRFEISRNDGGTIQPQPCPSTFKVETLKHADIDELSQVAAVTFCNREPLTCALLKHPKRAIRFRNQIQHLCKNLVDEGLSFVARKKVCAHGCEDRGCCGEMLGFSLAQPVERDSNHTSLNRSCFLQNSAFSCLLQGILPVCSFSQLPELKPADDLYKELFDRWCSWRDTELGSNECVNIMLSGATEACDYGTTVVSACEAAVLDAARVKGFRVAYTINTNEVTEYIAAFELGMRRRVALQAMPFLRSRGLSALQASRLQSQLTEEHQVVLFDILIGVDGYVDTADEAGSTSRLRLLDLRKNPGTAEKVDNVVEAAFRYYRRGDISRELRHLQCRDGQVLVLEDATSGSIIGCATLFYHETSEREVVEVLLLAVEPKQRGRGASKRILAEIKRLGRREGWSHVFLHANDAVRHLYESNGFEEANTELTSDLSLLVSNDENDKDKRAKVEPENQRLASLFCIDLRKKL
jgi:acyl-coenzyme A synthetase/AMP-(fatty) acid ligase/N-acetylglutamate synthase-like GNAT family acetyltransferase